MVHELPGVTPRVIAFGEEVAATVVPRVCVRREFTVLRAGRTSPVAGWLRSLARELHADVGGPGVGPSACASPAASRWP